jgi:hypothetical protein
MMEPREWCPADLPRRWNLAWRVGVLPEGDVEVWVAVFTDDGRFMGGSIAAERPSWLWRGGNLCCDYSPVVVEVILPGVYSTGLICAVSPAAKVYRGIWPISLGEGRRMRRGDHITIVDGIIEIKPDLPGPHG